MSDQEDGAGDELYKKLDINLDEYVLINFFNKVITAILCISLNGE